MRAAIAAAALLLALLVAEAGGQLAFRARSGHWLWQDDEFSSNTVVPYAMPVGDRREYALKPNYRDASGHLNIDPDGFRRTVPPPSAQDRVVVNLGDSVPFGSGCCTDEDTYSSYLAQDFARAGVHLGVVNAGVPSYNIRQSFDRFHADVLPRYGWDRIAAVTMVAANDISLVTRYGAEYTPELTWSRGRRFVVLRPGWQRVATAYYLAGGLNQIAAPSSRPGESSAGAASPEETMLAGVRSTLRSEIQTFESHGVPLVLISVNPYFYQLSHQERNSALRILRENYHGSLPPQEVAWSKLVGRVNDTIRASAAQSRTATFLDTRVIFDAVDRDGLYTDYIHFTPPGSRLMTDALLSHLRSKGVKEIAGE